MYVCVGGGSGEHLQAVCGHLVGARRKPGAQVFWISGRRGYYCESCRGNPAELQRCSCCSRYAPPPRSTGSAGGTTKRSSGLGHLRPVSGDTPEQMKTNRYMEKDQCARGGAADRLRRTRDGREGVADGEWHAQEEHFNHVLGRQHSTPYAINQLSTMISSY